MTHDGMIGVLYERGDQNPYKSIPFAHFNLAWATENTK